MKNTKLITFEGGEGSGKSTQAKLLYNALKISKNKIILTREPGGTEVSEKIRKIIVTNNKSSIDALTELLLINAARNEHIKTLILPKLKSNFTVICDRFIDSTFAYQVAGHGLNEQIFRRINDLVINRCIPSITFLIDIPPEIGLKRSLKIKKKENRFEYFNSSFHTRVRKGFNEATKKNRRIYKINGKKSIKVIHKEIIDKINSIRIYKNKIQYALND